MEFFQKNSTPKAMNLTTNLIISWKQRAQKFNHTGINHVLFKYMLISTLSGFEWKAPKLKELLCIQSNNYLPTRVHVIVDFLLQERKKIEAMFIFKETKHMNHGNFYQF
jgi:hypothetical protein